MEIVSRLLADVFTIAILLSIAVGHGLTAVNRRGTADTKALLFLSLFVFFLSVFVFLGNSLTEFLMPGFQSHTITVPAITFCSYALYVFGCLYLGEILELKPQQKKPISVSLLLMTNLPVVVSLTFFLGYAWYLRFLQLPVMAVFLIMFFGFIIYFTVLLIRTKKYNNLEALFSVLGIGFIGIYLLLNTIILCRNTALPEKGNYLILIVLVLIFVFLLSRRDNQELKELRDIQRSRLIGTSKERPRKENGFKTSFNEKEQTVIDGLCEGKLYKEIASELDISLSMVKKIVHAIYQKAGVQNRFELIQILQENRNESYKR